MRKSTGLYPNVHVDATARRVVAHGGASLLVGTARKVGLDRALSDGLAPWMRPLAVHDPGKVVLDLAMSLVIGGDCLADIAELRAEPAIFGRVASDPTVSRLVDALATDSTRALAAIGSARAAARAAAWRLAGDDAPDYGIDKDAPLVIDLDATRLIVRAERPHPGAQLRFTDSNGWRLTAFVTNTTGGQHAQLELRHRRRARCEDRIRNAKDTGLANLPLHDFAQNEIWLAIVALACDLTAWMQMLALTPHVARRWEPKRLRLRLLSVPGTIAHRARRTRLRLSARAPHVAVVIAGIARLKTVRLVT